MPLTNWIHRHSASAYSDVVCLDFSLFFKCIINLIKLMSLLCSWFYSHEIAVHKTYASCWKDKYQAKSNSPAAKGKEIYWRIISENVCTISLLIGQHIIFPTSSDQVIGFYSSDIRLPKEDAFYVYSCIGLIRETSKVRILRTAKGAMVTYT